MKRVVKIVVILFALFFPILSLAEEKKVTLYFFHGDGCPHCADEEIFLERIEKKYPELEIVKYEVWYDDENALLLTNVEKAFDITVSGVPTNVIGNTVIKGFSDANSEKIERAIKYYLEHDYEDVVLKIKNESYNYEEKIDDDFSKEEEKTDEKLSIKIPFLGKVNLKYASLSGAAAIIGLIDDFNPTRK